MKHFREKIFSIIVVLCTATAYPMIINMKIGSTPYVASIEPAEIRAFPTSNRYRFTRSNAVPEQDSKIMRIIDVNQTPQMLGNERGARLHLADGAYPVYYNIARVNGQFHGGKYIRSFASEDAYKGFR